MTKRIGRGIERHKVAIILTSMVIGLTLAYQLNGGSVRKACAAKDPIDKALISNLLGLQHVHHSKYGHFLGSMAEIEKYDPETINHLKQLNSKVSFDNWNFDIYQKGDSLIIFALAKTPNQAGFSIRSAVGILAYNSVKGYTRKICRSEQPGLISVNQSVLEQSQAFSCPDGTYEDC